MMPVGGVKSTSVVIMILNQIIKIVFGKIYVWLPIALKKKMIIGWLIKLIIEMGLPLAGEAIKKIAKIVADRIFIWRNDKKTPQSKQEMERSIRKEVAKELMRSEPSLSLEKIADTLKLSVDESEEIANELYQEIK